MRKVHACRRPLAGENVFIYDGIISSAVICIVYIAVTASVVTWPWEGEIKMVDVTTSQTKFSLSTTQR